MGIERGGTIPNVFVICGVARLSDANSPAPARNALPTRPRIRRAVSVGSSRVAATNRRKLGYIAPDHATMHGLATTPGEYRRDLSPDMSSERAEVAGGGSF